MLSTVLLVGCVACIIVAQIFILRSSLGATVVPRGNVLLPRARRGAEIAWALLPAIALALVLWMTWQEARAVMSPRPDSPVHDGHGAHTS